MIVFESLFENNSNVYICNKQYTCEKKIPDLLPYEDSIIIGVTFGFMSYIY